MHILDQYISSFEQALEQHDSEEALFQLVLMLQRDPLDQEQRIIRELMRYEDAFGSLSDQAGSVCKNRLFETRKWLQQGPSVEQLEVAFGEALQQFVDEPNRHHIKRINKLSKELIDRGVLERANTEIPESNHPPQMSNTQPVESHEIFSNSPSSGLELGIQVRKMFIPFLRRLKERVKPNKLINAGNELFSGSLGSSSIIEHDAWEETQSKRKINDK